MSDLTLMVLRLGFLVLLWLFVFSVIFALRSDLFGSPVRRMKQQPSQPITPSSGSPQVITQPAAPSQPPVITPSGGALPSASAESSGGSSRDATQLVILTGVAAGTSIPLDESTVTIGRSPDSTLVIVDEYTSTYHAKLQRGADGWTIVDLDSTNGTKLAGVKLTSPRPLPTYTHVTIGTTTFELRP